MNGIHEVVGSIPIGSTMSGSSRTTRLVTATTPPPDDTGTLSHKARGRPERRRTAL